VTGGRGIVRTDLIAANNVLRVPREVRVALAHEQHRALQAAVRIDALSAVGSHAHRRLAGVVASQQAFAELVPESRHHLEAISLMAAEGIVAAVGRLAFEEL